MKVVVTGATGNVGTSVLRALAREPSVTEIVGIARRPAEFELDKVRLVLADVSKHDLQPLFAGASAVVHLAWMIQPERQVKLLERNNVQGSRNVFLATVAAGVPTLLYASSVGVYGPGPKNRTVEETWDTSGTPSSPYSQQKVAVERMLTGFEKQHPSLRVVRMRPALIFKRGAGSELRRRFLGPWVPRSVFKPSRIPVVPDVEGLRFQCVHGSDVAEAFRLALVSDVRGAFNLAAEPSLGPEQLAQVLDARRVRVSPKTLRTLTDVAYRLHLQRTSAGWLDMALQLPMMDTFRARNVLGWRPQWNAAQTLLEALEGVAQGAGLPTAPLKPANGSAAPV